MKFMRCALFCAKLPIVVAGIVGKSICCKCCLMQMQCKTAKLLQVEWHRLRAIVSRKNERNIYAVRIHDNKMRYTKKKY